MKNINKISKVSFWVLSVCFIVLASCTNTKKEDKNKTENPRPNIVFILSDDHAYQAISAYGYPVGKLAPTPNIDRIANEGIRFNNAFVTNSLCGPSRATILTGKYSHLNGFKANGDVFNARQMTFPKLLQKNGYQTAVIGKWHLVSLPTGFDYYDILIGQGNYYNPDFIENGDTSRRTGYVTDLITQYALHWLDQGRDKNKPFCLMIHNKAPHRNWMPNLKNIDKYDNVEFPVPETYFDDYHGRLAASQQQMNIYRDMYEGADLKMSVAKGSDSLLYCPRNHNILSRMTPEQARAWKLKYRVRNDRFYDMHFHTGRDIALWKYQRYLREYLSTISSVDENVGKVLQYLDDHGLSENTIVVYTSDQGFYLGEHGWFDKRWIYQESLRTPLLVRYPKDIKAGRVSDQFVSNLDFAETFLDYAGVPVPEEMQGRSLRPVLENDNVKDWRTAMYYHYYEYPGWHMVKRHYGIHTRRYTLVHFYNDIDTWEFYDLQNDPDEMNNLIDDERYKPVIDSLRIELKKLMIKYKEPPYEQFKDEKIDQGRKPFHMPPQHLKYPINWADTE